MYQNNPALPINKLPTMYDLPSEDPEEMGWPDKFHYLQTRLFAAKLRELGVDVDGIL
jgi:hypothetical protein